MIYGHIAQTQGGKLSGVLSSSTKNLLDLLDEHPVRRRYVISCIDLKLGLAAFCIPLPDGWAALCQGHSCCLFIWLSYLCLGLVLNVKNRGAFSKSPDACIWVVTYIVNILGDKNMFANAKKRMLVSTLRENLFSATANCCSKVYLSSIYCQ